MKKSQLFHIALTLLFCLWVAAFSSAQTYSVVVNFDHTDGSQPDLGTPIQGADGNIYGATYIGGANTNFPYCNLVSSDNSCGTLYKFTPSSGTLTTLYNFCEITNCVDGSNPAAGLVLGTDGNFYGTASSGGGTADAGTVFKFTPSGALTTLGSGGFTPYGTLIQATDGNFYGTTLIGGNDNWGNVFKITPSGTVTNLHSFTSHDGAEPWGGLVQGTDGNFYGLTGGLGFGSGAHRNGSAFKITASGKFSVIHAFGSIPNDGVYPYSWLVQGADGNFYGTASTYGGGYGCVFQMTPSGTVTIIHSFADPDGGDPFAGLTLGSDGNFYGVTTSHGAYGFGTIFQISPSGAFVDLHDFDGTDGETSYGGIMQATDGTFYGGANRGGAYGDGVLYHLDLGLPPFVADLPTIGRTGQSIKILGNNLTGTSSVTFNGTAATFTVVSATLIKATVPTGATTGPVQVVTPSGTLTSNLAFQVR